MLSLTPNQQCQSHEGKITLMTSYIDIICSLCYEVNAYLKKENDISSTILQRSDWYKILFTSANNQQTNITQT